MRLVLNTALFGVLPKKPSMRLLGQLAEWAVQHNAEVLRAQPGLPSSDEVGPAYVDADRDEEWNLLPYAVHIDPLDCEDIALWDAAAARVRRGGGRVALEPVGKDALHMVALTRRGRMDPRRFRR